MAASKLQKLFPWVVSPVICSGPMRGAASPALAASVSKAGGIGFLPAVFDLNPDSADIKSLDDSLAKSRDFMGGGSQDSEGGLLKVGASFITGHASITSFADTVVPILRKHRPVAVWLFAPDDTVRPHPNVISAIRSLGYPARIVVQVGNVATAREAVEHGADVIVCQGIDAGGHQFRRGMGVVSFVPEVRAMLEEEFPGKEVSVLAAGGIVNGKGVAAALALGADGVVMGTRFLVANESVYPEFRKQTVLETSDGGSTTFKSEFNDQINNNPLWGPLYDGRAIMTTIHRQFLGGSSLQELQTTLKEDYSAEESTKLISTWAGTGVGMVRKVQPAAEIVEEVRKEAKQTIQNLAQHM